MCDQKQDTVKVPVCIDWTKPVRMRNGVVIRVLAMDFAFFAVGDPHAVLGCVRYTDAAQDSLGLWKLDGTPIMIHTNGFTGPVNWSAQYRASCYQAENIPAFDPARPCRTRDGREVFIATENYPDTMYPLYGMTKGAICGSGWTRKGSYYVDERISPSDLVNV